MELEPGLEPELELRLQPEPGMRNPAAELQLEGADRGHEWDETGEDGVSLPWKIGECINEPVGDKAMNW